jgi:hypothetical protein
VDVQPNMLIYERMTDGIRGTYDPPPNDELINYTLRIGKKLPTSYHHAIFDREFLRNDFSKYYQCYPWWPDERALAWAERAFALRYQPFLFSYTMSEEEAILQMDMTKSPGFPLNKIYKTKREAWEREKELIKLVVSQIRRGQRICYTFLGVEYHDLFWLASPKGEFRPLSKIINADPSKRKTRVFLAGDFITQLISIMIYGNQNNQLLEAHKHNMWMLLGFSPFYCGWDRMTRRVLNGVANRILNCWDVKHMEASIREYFYSMIYRLRNQFIIRDDEEDNFFSFLFHQFCYSLTIDVDGYLTQMLGNNSSGGFNTLTDNCFALELAIYYSLAKRCQTFEEFLSKLDQHNVVILGDDSITPEHVDFNHLQDDLVEIGFQLEPEIRCVSIQNAVFLNSGFKMYRNLWLPVPNFDKIRANILFNFKKNSWRLAYVKCCAYRTLAWPYPEFRKEADAMCNYIRKYKKFELEAEELPSLTYFATVQTYLEPATLNFLWTGNERFSKPVGVVFNAALDRLVPGDISTFVDVLNFALDL